MTSRLTFREAAGTVAWQKQLRDQHLGEGTPPVPHLAAGAAVVRRISRHAAAQIILRYEWLGTMANTTHHYGIFFGPYCAGVCCVAASFGTGGANVAKELGLRPRQVATLARGACVHWAPMLTNSKLIAWTGRLLRRDLPEASLVIAYSDTDAGEIGTVYQAAGWTCIGRGGAAPQFVAPSGRVYDWKLGDRLKQRHGVSRSEAQAALLAAGWTVQRANPKWRYVFVLDKTDQALLRRIARLRRPYPKRAGSIGSDAAGGQPAEGGATPTPALREAVPV